MQCAYVATVHNRSTRVNGYTWLKFKPGRPGGDFGGTGFRVGKERVEPRALSYLMLSVVLSTSETSPCWAAEACSYTRSESKLRCPVCCGFLSDPSDQSRCTEQIQSSLLFQTRTAFPTAKNTAFSKALGESTPQHTQRPQLLLF